MISLYVYHFEHVFLFCLVSKLFSVDEHPHVESSNLYETIIDSNNKSIDSETDVEEDTLENDLNCT